MSLELDFIGRARLLGLLTKETPNRDQVFHQIYRGSHGVRIVMFE